MTPFELKKMQVEYKRVNAAREEQELKILELMETIERIKASIEISIKREHELQDKIKAAQVE